MGQSLDFLKYSVNFSFRSSISPLDASIIFLIRQDRDEPGMSQREYGFEKLHFKIY